MSEFDIMTERVDKLSSGNTILDILYIILFPTTSKRWYYAFTYVFSNNDTNEIRKRLLIIINKLYNKIPNQIYAANLTWKDTYDTEELDDITLMDLMRTLNYNEISQ